MRLHALRVWILLLWVIYAMGNLGVTLGAAQAEHRKCLESPILPGLSLRTLNKLGWKSSLPKSDYGTELGEAAAPARGLGRVTFFFFCKYSCHANSTKGCITGSANSCGNFSFRVCIFKVRKKTLVMSSLIPSYT